MTSTNGIGISISISISIITSITNHSNIITINSSRTTSDPQQHPP